MERGFGTTRALLSSSPSHLPILSCVSIALEARDFNTVPNPLGPRPHFTSAGAKFDSFAHRFFGAVRETFFQGLSTMKNSKVPLEIVLFGTSTTGSVSPSIHRLKARRNQIAMALVAFVRFGRLDTAWPRPDFAAS